MRELTVGTVVAAIAVAGMAACGAGPVSTAAPPPSPAPPAPAGADACRGREDAASYPPIAPPASGAMPAGSYMAEIQRRGRLRAAVSADTYLMAYRDPVDAELKGFDIDIVREVARALFGDPSRVDFTTIARNRRIEVLERAEVDLVAHTFRMTCDRWRVISFSSEYFRSEQRLLVRSDSPVTTLDDLVGQEVCATEGSTTLDEVRKVAGVVAVGAEDPSDCLVRFQQGEVAAISSDETVLHGLAEQDPYARVVGPGFAAQPYGLGVSRSHPDFVRFINGVLDQVRRSGRWRQLYLDRLARHLPDATMPVPDHSRPLP